MQIILTEEQQEEFMAERFYNENAKEIAELNYQEKGLEI